VIAAIDRKWGVSSGGIWTPRL